MATMKANQRVQIGSAPWITEERSSANTIADTESEEFSFSVRNDVDWLNEHMAEIFSENQVYVDTLVSFGNRTDEWIGTSRTSLKHLESYGRKHQRLDEKPTHWKRVQYV